MDYEATFELFDVNGDGNVGADELHSVFVRCVHGVENMFPNALHRTAPGMLLGDKLLLVGKRVV